MHGVPIGSDGLPGYRMSSADSRDALLRLRSEAGLFMETGSPLPVGARCVLELMGSTAVQRSRVEAIVVARRMPGGAGQELAPGMTMRLTASTEAPREPLRAVTALPAGSTPELVQALWPLLARAHAAFDVPLPLEEGERFRLTTGTVRWPGAVSFEARVVSCVRNGSSFRCAVTCGEEKDLSALATFIERMRTAIAARETSEGFRVWTPQVMGGSSRS